ncbi:MAG: hypothetical protein HY423_14140 [Candidatus Lambdaproteobacteria bacterium]|nr:hypothetical protein [Candidatus Lambdaproteobacteria bacterium]
MKPTSPAARAALGGAGAALLAALLFALGAIPAHAEYRAYELEVVDRVDCAINKRPTCPRTVVKTSMSPEAYAGVHGGDARIGVVLLATWMCYGDTSGYRDICPRPQPRTPKFAVGETVKVALHNHITEGWQGKVELVYYQQSVRANVYGVRFAERQNVFARYFEKDLAKAAPAQPLTEPPR